MSTTLSGNHESPKSKILKRNKARSNTPLSCKIEYYIKTNSGYFSDQSAFFTDDYVPWYGIYVTSGTPDALAAKINAAISKALENPDVQRQLSVTDIPGKPMSLPDLAALMKADFEKLSTVVKTAGMSLQ
jgi:hypothetical protein